MRIRRALAAIVATLASLPVVVASAGPCAAAAAQGANRAGLVIQYSDERTEEFCVSFTEETLTGFELLRRTGLTVAAQEFGAGDVTVCRIDGVGCDHPAQPCFCECEDPRGTCTFWGAYRIDAATGKWRFAEVGAGKVEVRPGDVHGWRWGSHGEAGSAPPGAADLAGVCARGTAIGIDGAAAPGSRDRGSVPVVAIVAGLALLVTLALLARRLGGSRGEQ